MPVNIADLLRVYDQYPKVVQALNDANTLHDRNAEKVEYSERRYLEIKKELELEKEGRVKDGELAEKAKGVAEKEREKKIREELAPKIKGLEDRVAGLLGDKSRLEEELAGKRKQVEGWIGELEKLGKEKREQEEKERVALKEKERVISELQDLDGRILEGLRESLLKDPVVTPVASVKSSRNNVENGSIRSKVGTESIQASTGTAASDWGRSSSTKQTPSIRTAVASERTSAVSPSPLRESSAASIRTTTPSTPLKDSSASIRTTTPSIVSPSPLKDSSASIRTTTPSIRSPTAPSIRNSTPSIRTVSNSVRQNGD
jgi:hypothetical protein